MLHNGLQIMGRKESKSTKLVTKMALLSMLNFLKLKYRKFRDENAMISSLNLSSNQFIQSTLANNLTTF